MSKLALLVGLPGVGLFGYAAVQAAAEGGLPSPVVLIVPSIVILVLVLLNGLFVAAEIAIVGVRSSQIEQMADEGNKLAKYVFDVVDSRRKQDEFIATAQLGITIVSLGLAMYGEPQIAHFIEPYVERWFNDPPEAFVATAGYFTALSLLTYLHIVVGEMVPKTLALTDPAQVSMRLARPMQVIQTILGVPVRFLNAIGRMLLRLFRVPPVEGHERVLSREELELIVTESAQGGLLNLDEEEMIRNIFDFGERTVGQVLTPRRKVQAISEDMPYEEIIQLVAASNHSRFPVYEGSLDHIIGSVHIKDLVHYSLKPNSRFDIRLLLRSVPVVPEDYRVETLLAAFKKQHQHIAVVLDEFGGMAGLVTLEDLIEEVVGEVRDEFDQEKEPFIEVAPGVVELAGEYLVDDLLEDVVFLGEPEELPDVETVGGLIVAQLGRPPVIGDQVTYNNELVRMKVLAVDGRAVSRARIEFPVIDSTDASQTAVSPSADAKNNQTMVDSPRIEPTPERREKWDSS